MCLFVFVFISVSCRIVYLFCLGYTFGNILDNNFVVLLRMITNLKVETLHIVLNK